MDPIKESAGSEGTGPARVSWYFRLSLILASLLFVYANWPVGRFGDQTPTIDFFTYWTVPQFLSHQPAANIYSPAGRRAIGSATASDARSRTASDVQRKAAGTVLDLYGGTIDSNGSPFLYSSIAWISSGNYQTDQKRFAFLCTLCLVLSVLITQNVLRLSAAATIALTMFLSWSYEPARADMRVGNVSEIQLFAITLFIFFTARSHPLLAGLTIGAATMFKPTTLMVLVLAVIAQVLDRQYHSLWRMILGCLIAVGGSVVASTLTLGHPAMWVDFVRSLAITLDGTSYPLENGNFSLSALLFGSTGPNSGVIPVTLLVCFPG